MEMAFKKNLLDISSTRTQSCYPCLVHGIKEKDERVFHNIFDEHHFSAKIPCLSNTSILVSHDGWWVVQDLANKDCLFILNPLSMERIDLPKLKSSSQSFVGCIILNSPKNPDCRIFLFDGSHEVLSYQVGDSVFRKQVLVGEIPRSVMMFGGRIYGLLDPTNELVSISVEGDTLQSRSVIMGEEAKPHPEEAYHYEGYLIESNDELLHVFKSYKTSFYWEVDDFFIHKMDFATSKWKKVKTIGDHRALFLDEKGGSSCNVEGGGRIKGNRIYYVDSHSYRVNVFGLKEYERFYSQDLVLPSSPAVDVDENYDNHMFRWVSLPKL